MEKDRKRRLRDIGDALTDLDEAATGPPTSDSAVARVTKQGWQRALPSVAGFLFAVVTGLAVWNLKPDPAELRQIGRFSHVLAEGEAFTRTGRPIVTLSPDGRRIVYVANQQLYLRNLDELNARPIQGTDENPTTPFFSPDNEWIGFYSDGQLKRIAITGGTPVTLCEAENPFGASWAANGMIFYGQSNGVMRVSADGGVPELVIETDAGEQVHGPELLPDGQTLLFALTAAASATRWDEAAIVVQRLDGSERKVIWTGGSDARYVPTGHLV